MYILYGEIEKLRTLLWSELCLAHSTQLNVLS